MEWATITIEVRKTEQPPDVEASPASRESPLGEPSDRDIEDLKMELLLLAGLGPSPRKKRSCFPLSVPPSQVPVLKGQEL